MVRSPSLFVVCLFGARIAVADTGSVPPPVPSDSSKASALADSVRSQALEGKAVDSSSLMRSGPDVPATTAKDSASPARTSATRHFLEPSFGWTLGVGAPSFPFRERFRSELALTDTRDSELVVDQPWDGSQLGFSTGFEVGAQRGFVRAIAGAEWSFWDSRAVARKIPTGELIERTWRVDQLMGLVGVDLIMPRRLLTVTGGTEPYFGIRSAWGVGRMVGLGRAWAYGGGWQAHVGADVTNLGPFVLGGRLGWNSLSLSSSQSTRRVLYDGGSDETIDWNGSGLWLTMTLRLRPPRPVPPEPAKAKPVNRAPSDSSSRVP